jgi:hypothetical protein
MSRWIKLMAILALAAIIPLQGVAAVAMPLCAMPTNSMTGNMQVNAEHGSTGLEVMNDPTACSTDGEDCCRPLGKSSFHQHTDQHCFMCYLSLLQIPTAFMTITPSYNGVGYPEPVIEPYQTFIPALFRPPKLLSA